MDFSHNLGKQRMNANECFDIIVENTTKTREKEFY